MNHWVYFGIGFASGAIFVAALIVVSVMIAFTGDSNRNVDNIEIRMPEVDHAP